VIFTGWWGSSVRPAVLSPERQDCGARFLPLAELRLRNPLEFLSAMRWRRFSFPVTCRLDSACRRLRCNFD
jgi:hypothetical protein